jgi:hypothetical protein
VLDGQSSKSKTSHCVSWPSPRGGNTSHCVFWPSPTSLLTLYGRPPGRFLVRHAPSPTSPTDPMPAGPRTVGRPYTRIWTTILARLASSCFSSLSNPHSLRKAHCVHTHCQTSCNTSLSKRLPNSTLAGIAKGQRNKPRQRKHPICRLGRVARKLDFPCSIPSIWRVWCVWGVWSALSNVSAVTQLPHTCNGTVVENPLTTYMQ